MYSLSVNYQTENRCEFFGWHYKWSYFFLISSKTDINEWNDAFENGINRTDFHTPSHDIGSRLSATNQSKSNPIDVLRASAALLNRGRWRFSVRLRCNEKFEKCYLFTCRDHLMRGWHSCELSLVNTTIWTASHSHNDSTWCDRMRWYCLHIFYIKYKYIIVNRLRWSGFNENV